MAIRQDTEAQVRLLADTSSSVRMGAVKALGRIGAPAAPVAAEPLASLLMDAEASVRMQAARAFSKMGEAAAPFAIQDLTRCLDDSEAVVRAAAVGSLGYMATSIGQPTLAALAQCLHDGDARVRVATAGTFGRVGAKALSEVAEAFVGLLKDEEQSVQVAAAGALARHHQDVAMALVGRLESGDEHARCKVAKALGCLGHLAAPHATEALTQCLSDSSAEIKAEAAAALDLMGVAPVPVPQTRQRPTLPAKACGASNEDTSPSESCRWKRTRSLGWAEEVEDKSGEARVGGRLPRLLGTPTPRRAAAKPDFCIPPQVPEKAVPTVEASLVTEVPLPRALQFA